MSAEVSVELVECGVAERVLLAAPVPESVLILPDRRAGWSLRYARDRRSMFPRFILVDQLENNK